MEQYNFLNKTDNVKDNIKGHKIAGALYLVTQHLSDTDPLKNALRTHAVALTTAQDSMLAALAPAITALLDTAVIARLISEKNASIIILEVRHYVANLTASSDVVSSLFTVFDNQTPNSQPLHTKMSYSTHPLKVSNPSKIIITNDSKSKRQDTILSFINERKSASIKDIAALFSDTSEKTIQRELGLLVSSGKISKRGEKRWSMYLAIA